MSGLEDIKKELKASATRAWAEKMQSYFKSSKGEYAEGDVFIGVTMPRMREVAKLHRGLSGSALKKLLKSKVHEERLTALLILVEQYAGAGKEEREKLYAFYLDNLKYVNNWDLVDTSAPRILGAHLLKKDKSILMELAASESIWDRRVAIISTLFFIRKGLYTHTLKLSKRLLKDESDLIHKATGWMLREVGKRDTLVLENFLKKHYKAISRTTLRYAIERFEEGKRKAFLKGTFGA